MIHQRRWLRFGYYAAITAALISAALADFLFDDSVMGWALCILWVCTFVPFDVGIARYNVLNCRELSGSAGPIDIAYLQELGPDAIPAIDLLIERLPAEHADRPPTRQNTRGGWVELFPARYDDPVERAAGPLTLRDRLNQIRIELAYDLDEQLDDWRGWTARRAWLHETVSQPSAK